MVILLFIFLKFIFNEITGQTIKLFFTRSGQNFAKNGESNLALYMMK